MLELLGPVERDLAEALWDVRWLEPFGVEIRYPYDRPETLPGDEWRARQLAQKTRDAVLAVLRPYLR